jgi:hypothetical protein
MLLQTPYPYMKPESSKETASMASVAPYEHTRILFHPEERRMERETLINLLRAAQAKNMLDGVDKLVFFTLLWSRTLAEYPALDFMHCPWVKAHAVIFPKTPPGHVVLLEISKEELFDQIVSLSGKQHSCFKPAVAQ